MLLGTLASVLTSCAVAPRLPLDVQRAVNRDAMRVLRTQSLDLYYPEKFEREARALAERAEGCIAPLRQASIGRGGLSEHRLELIFPDVPFNNAFVNPPLNGDFFSVIPTHWTFDIMAETGLPPDPGYVACHELTHYIQAQQTLRSLGLLDRAFGYLISPQYGLDTWFWEGLATHYEQALQPGTGRPAWPAWEGMFRAAVADKNVDGGDLSALNRKLHWGNHYVYGSRFVGWLIETYGETRLWKLIERQGESFFFPFIVNQRFRRVYGKNLSALIDEFSLAMRARYPARARPPAQRTLRGVGMNGRYARAADGSEAVIADAMDAPPTLTVYGPDGSERYRARLTDVLPKRDLVAPDSRLVSGLRFSRDAQHVYFVAVDPDLVFQQTRLMHLDLRTRALSAIADDLGGLGGDISPDGKHYVFVRVTGHGHALASYELATGNVRELHRPPANVYFSSPTFSPDGSKLAVGVFAGSYALELFDAASGARLRTLSPSGGPLSDVSFVDDDTLLFLGEHEGRFQAFAYALSSRALTRLTDAPYLAMQPRAARGTVRFFNREGLGYTLDEVPLPSAGVPGPQAAGARRFAQRVLADVQPADAGVASPPTTGAAPTSAVGPSPSAPAPLPPADGGAPLDFSGVVTGGAQTAAPAGASAPTEAHGAPGPLPAPAAPQGAQGSTPATPQGQTFSVAPIPSTLAATPAGAPLATSTRAPLSIVEDQWLTLPPPPSLALIEARDEPYSVFPRLLIPSVRAPQFSLSNGQSALGLYLGGTDALGKHRWGASLGLQPVVGLWSGSVGYLNAQLSPLLLSVAASQLNFDARTTKRDDVDGDGEREPRIIHDHRRQRDLSLTATLRLRTSQLWLSLHATNERQWDGQPVENQPQSEAVLDPVERERTLSGGTLGFLHSATESTPMSGPRRGYWTELSASYYPQSLGTLPSDIADLRGELWLYSPLPLSRRHTLRLGLRARGVLSDEPERLLELGGSWWSNLYDHPRGSNDDAYPGLPPKLRFRESLRGFETAHFLVKQVGIIDLAYRYPIIFDRGTATSLWILPAFFLRQVDLELFASGASDKLRRIDYDGHLAVGASVTLRFVWLAPIALRYQVAQRFTDGRDLQHLIALGLDLGP
jgi:hypothetical protein